MILSHFTRFKVMFRMSKSTISSEVSREISVDGEVKEYKKQGDLGFVTVEKDGETKTYISTTSNFIHALPADCSVVFIPVSN